MRDSIADSLLRMYEVPVRYHSSMAERLFGLTFSAVLSSFIGLGFFLHSIKALPAPIETVMTEMKARFVIEEETHPAPRPFVKEKAVENPSDPSPVDLSQKPLLSQPYDDIHQEMSPTTTPAPRRVFGLRRVYSVGLGSGGSTSDAIVGKIGNTINKEYDTVTATESDIKGTVVSTAMVTTAPRFRKIVKPSYTKKMIDGKIEGTVKVRILVDIDGRVKKATCLNDIGFDSVSQAVQATLQMEFDPAMRGSDPVAVWIVVPIRFVLLG